MIIYNVDRSQVYALK